MAKEHSVSAMHDIFFISFGDKAIWISVTPERNSARMSLIRLQKYVPKCSQKQKYPIYSNNIPKRHLYLLSVQIICVCGSEERAYEYDEDEGRGDIAYYEPDRGDEPCPQGAVVRKLRVQQSFRREPSEPYAQADRHERQHHVCGQSVEEVEYVASGDCDARKHTL